MGVYRASDTCRSSIIRILRSLSLPERSEERHVERRHVRVKVIENEIEIRNSIIFLFVNSLHLQSHSPSRSLRSFRRQEGTREVSGMSMMDGG